MPLKRSISIFNTLAILISCLILTSCKSNNQNSVKSNGAAESSINTTSTVKSNEVTVNTENSSTESTITESSVGTSGTVTEDDNLWFSEKAGVRGRIWLGMTEKQVYDVLMKYNIKIDPYFDNMDHDSLGAGIITDSPYSKQLDTVGHQFYEFDKNDRLVEITYFEKLHQNDDPVDQSFYSERGLKRGDSYDKMIQLYGQPIKTEELLDMHGYAYKLENGGYVIFTFVNNSYPMNDIVYSTFITPLVFATP